MGRFAGKGWLQVQRVNSIFKNLISLHLRTNLIQGPKQANGKGFAVANRVDPRLHVLAEGSRPLNNNVSKRFGLTRQNPLNTKTGFEASNC